MLAENLKTLILLPLLPKVTLKVGYYNELTKETDPKYSNVEHTPPQLPLSQPKICPSTASCQATAEDTHDVALPGDSRRHCQTSATHLEPPKGSLGAFSCPQPWLAC